MCIRDRLKRVPLLVRRSSSRHQPALEAPAAPLGRDPAAPACRPRILAMLIIAPLKPKPFMNSTVSSANYFSEAPPRGASSQPREREARTDTPTHPPSPRQTAPQPRASPGGGRPAAIPHRLGRTRAGSKLSAGPPRGAAQHRQPQKGAERACDASTVKIRSHFLASGDFA